MAAGEDKVQKTGIVPAASVDRFMTQLARLATIGGGAFVIVLALYLGQVLLAPIILAVVIGLMFGPIADRIERLGIPPGLSAIFVVLLFLVLIATVVVALAVPLSAWVEKLPVIWARLQDEIAKWQGTLTALENLQHTAKTLFSSEENVVVTVDENSPVGSAAYIAPLIGAQILAFLVSMYFFIATRHQIRVAVLSLCLTRRLRWRMARVFRDVEMRISRYMIAITAINIGLGASVSFVLWLAAAPTPLLWGLLAAIVNYIAYLGPAVMIAILLAVGLGTASTLSGILLPAGLYLALNFISDQFVSPHVVGRSMRLNPFFVFLALAFWLWLWGPVGGFIAVPALLVCITVLEHLIPSATLVEQAPAPRHRPLPLTTGMPAPVRR